MLLACSSGKSKPGSWLPSAGGADARAGGGEGGETDVAPPAAGGSGADVECESDADCDDRLTCNGRESCVAGSCIAGAALECGEYLACVEDDGGSCVFEDQSPWVIYTADDDTVAQTEIYAVKRDLIGEMTPIKLNDTLPRGAGIGFPEWSINRELFRYTVATADGGLTTKLVHLSKGLPRQIGSFDGVDLFWSRSGRKLATSTTDGVSVYDYGSDGELSLLFTWSAPNAHVPARRGFRRRI